MKVYRSLFQDKSVLSAHEILSGAESTFGQSPCNNAQVTADRVAEFPHAESFAGRLGNSLNEFKRNQSAHGRPLTRLQGENAEMGQCLPTITDKNYSPLLGPSLNGYRPGSTFEVQREGPLQGLVSDFQWLAFARPMKRNKA